jgi:hypothetical protein
MRAALSGAAIGFGIAPSRAQQTLSQSDAKYQDTPKSGLTCAACSLFRPPRSGEIVQGDISPDGWCRFFRFAGLSRACSPLRTTDDRHHRA